VETIKVLGKREIELKSKIWVPGKRDELNFSGN
jgi:hypothetical protein